MEKKELKNIYDENFWGISRGDFNYRSAKIILPIIFEHYNPNSIIDIGCGIGTWMKAASELGISNIKGIDCNEISEENLLISRKYISIDNLETHKNINNEKYDLAISVEVAEHLSNECSENFISTLVSYSDIVLFSAAIPYQEGEYHINCQPPQFWYNIFSKYNYVCFDFRNELMNMWEDINPCYAQNMLLFVHKNKEYLFDKLSKTVRPLFFYHPAYVNIIVNDNITQHNIDNSNNNIFNLLSILDFNLFSIKSNDKYITIILFGIKISFKKGDQTRPDQTRPDQYVKSTYYFIIIENIKNTILQHSFFIVFLRN